VSAGFSPITSASLCNMKVKRHLSSGSDYGKTNVYNILPTATSCGYRTPQNSASLLSTIPIFCCRI
ncbi:MAG: hypothetical protein RRY08_05765, partial [Christensenella sp.]